MFKNILIATDGSELAEKAVQQGLHQIAQHLPAGGMAAMGKVMAALKPKLAGRVDMAQVSAKVKAKLSG